MPIRISNAENAKIRFMPRLTEALWKCSRRFERNVVINHFLLKYTPTDTLLEAINKDCTDINDLAIKCREPTFEELEDNN